MNSDREVRTKRQFFTVEGAHDVAEPKAQHDALEFACGVARDQDGGVLVHVGDEPILVKVIGVNVRDVQVRRVADALHQLGRQLIVARKHEPRTEELRQKPWIANDRPVECVDEDARVTD